MAHKPADLPRWLDREALANYISVQVDELPRLARAGKLPERFRRLGPRSPRWDRLAVDAIFGASSACTETDKAGSKLVEVMLA